MVLCSFPTPSYQDSDFDYPYTCLIYLLVISRVSPVPDHTFHTYRFPYTGELSLVHFQFLPNFLGFRLFHRGSTFSLPLFTKATFTIRQNSLYVTVCMIVSTLLEHITHSLSTLYYYNAPSLTIRLTGNYRSWTFTNWRDPASLGTRERGVGNS